MTEQPVLLTPAYTVLKCSHDGRPVGYFTVADVKLEDFFEKILRAYGHITIERAGAISVGAVTDTPEPRRYICEICAGTGSMETGEMCGRCDREGKLGVIKPSKVA